MTKRTSFLPVDDYSPTIRRSPNFACKLKFHYRRGSALRQVVGALEMLAEGTDQRLVFASVEALRKMCWQYGADGKKTKLFSKRAVERALEVLRKQGMISRRVKLPVTWSWPKYDRKLNQMVTHTKSVDGGKKRTGVLLIDHAQICQTDKDDEYCTLAAPKFMCQWWPGVPESYRVIDPNSIFS